MAELTESEISILIGELERGGLTYIELQNELLDHLCCDIEVKMEQGIDFLRALEEVKISMGSACIQEIQEDTLQLINQKYRIMKRAMYVLGSVAPSLVIIGTIFKIMHWPGASIMLTLGLFLLAAIYLPIFVSIRIRDTRKEGKAVNRSMYIIGMIAGIIFIAGAVFKINHWPGAGIMIILTGLVTVGVFIPLLVINAINEKENQVQSFTVLVFVLSFIAIAFMTVSLRVSKDVMSSFVLGIEDNIRTENVIHQSNQVMVNTLDKLELSVEQSALVMDIVDRADNMNKYIDEVIKKMILESHKRNNQAISENGEIDFFEVMNKDGMNTPAEIMLGIDREVAEGAVIQGKMDKYRQLAAEVFGEKNPSVELALNTEGRVFPDGYEINWLSYKFEHLPMMSVLCQLTSIQVNTRVVEGEMLRFLLVRAGN